MSPYIDDLPRLYGELVVDFLWSPVAHGRIRSLDTSAAAAIPGVAALFTYRDLPSNLFGPILADEVLLAEETCSFIGQPIVVIAAENREAIKGAKAAIILDIEELEPVFSIAEAKKQQSFIGQSRTITRGDLDAGFAEADQCIEGTFRCGGQDHFYLESQAALVVPGEGQSLVVHSSTQHPSEVQEVIAHLLGLRNNQVVCMTTRMGGGFGGKECQATHPAAMAALVAHRLRRPARIVYSKDDDMHVTGKRHPFENDYRVGFTRDGLLTALDAQLYSDGGAFADLSTAVMARAMTHIDNAYFIPNLRVTGTVCRTNHPPNTAFRGFGGPQGVATIESIFEEIGQTLGIDAADVRRRNIYGSESHGPGPSERRDITHYGEVVQNNTLPLLFEEMFALSHYEKRRSDVTAFNAHSATSLRGLALTAVKFGISFNTKFLNQANALVNIYRDGSVQVSTGATEMGQGANTKIRQIVADELGILLDDVRVMVTSTEKNHNTSATAASSGTDLNGGAAVDACGRLRERLAHCAAAKLALLEPKLAPSIDSLIFAGGEIWDGRLPERRLPFREVVELAYHERVSLGERGFYATPGLDFDWATGSGNPFLYYTMGCAVSEVLIDRFTGALRVLRSDLLMDIGRSINPGIDRGQITGAFVQGLGWVTTEELRYSPRGELLTHSPTTYKIPGIGDLPEIFNVDWIDNDTNTLNVRASKAVGEPPLLLAISVWCAVKNAITYISNGSIPELRLPATGEEIALCMARYAGVNTSAVR